MHGPLAVAYRTGADGNGRYRRSSLSSISHYSYCDVIIIMGLSAGTFRPTHMASDCLATNVLWCPLIR